MAPAGGFVVGGVTVTGGADVGGTVEGTPVSGVVGGVTVTGGRDVDGIDVEGSLGDVTVDVTGSDPG